MQLTDTSVSIVMIGLPIVIHHRNTLKEDRWSSSHMIWLAVFEVFDVFMTISVAALAIAQATQVRRLNKKALNHLAQYVLHAQL